MKSAAIKKRRIQGTPRCNPMWKKETPSQRVSIIPHALSQSQPLVKTPAQEKCGWLIADCELLTYTKMSLVLTQDVLSKDQRDFLGWEETFFNSC